MDNSRTEAAINMLKQCKVQRMTYYEATQVLMQQGFTEEEIDDASDQFVYSDATPPSNDNTQSPAAERPASIIEQGHDVELQAAKQQLNKDFWYGFIPFVGGFYRMKQTADYTKYESLKTGYNRVTVFGIWLGVIVVAFFVTIFAPMFTFGNATLEYLSRYVGIIAAFVLLFFIFRKKN